ncbi:LacI family DNA-binding transcriptional regulator [Pseudonocardia sp. ICBG1293]|uniref:LacI family DNA-binding transcriptional regulator n=1 Tax=Pseudonocardia sp. ICBG1293 TaxID=2844382 RepID=UPI001CC9C614|nr:LacI family DNA-binding transcriptional regulator [Pseudonocardia sp. ICBG1293]
MNGDEPEERDAANGAPTDAPRMSRRTGAVTIYDVAERAGVAPSTVSRALSKPGRINATTEARIRRAAEELNFRVNPMARALHTGRTGTIALVVADITNPVVFGIVRGAEKAASAEGYTLIIAESQESGDAEGAAVRRILPSVDGVILSMSRLASDRIHAIAREKPLVLINRALEDVPAVVPDVSQGVTALLDHLDELGHRSLAYLSGPTASWMSERRWENLLDGAESRRMGLVEIGPNAPTIEGGRAALRRVVAARVTAAVAFNDLVAIGLMQAAAHAGVGVPGRLSVTGFDDIFGSELIEPALTTVRSPLQLAGRRAVEHLLAGLAGRTVEPAGALAAELVVRRSTAAPAGGLPEEGHPPGRSRGPAR